MFNSLAVQSNQYPNSDVLYIIKDNIFNGSVVDYIQTFDHSKIGKTPDPDDWGLFVCIHGKDNKWITGVKFSDIKIVNLKDSKVIDFKENLK